MTQSVAPDQKDVFVTVRMITDADGLPATGVVAATGGHLIEYRRDAAAVVTDGGSAADLATLTTAHTDWEFLHIFDGYYTVAIPDAAFVKGVGNVLVNMRATNISGVAESVIIDKFLKFQGKATGATATTTTFPNGTRPLQGDQIYVIEGTGDRQTRLVTSVSGEIATHLAWDSGRNISTSTSTIVLIPGDETLADGGINVDVAVSTRSTLTAAQSNAEADTALVDYDTAKQALVDAKLPDALSPGGKIVADVKEVNDVAIKGVGSLDDPWNPV